MANFEICTIAPGAYSLLDEGKSSFYLVEGEDRAAVIDTGVTPGGCILPTLRQLTQKPLVLCVTHGHFDHMYHADEFDTVYLCREELSLPGEMLAFARERKIDLKGTLDIGTGSVIDLGGCALEVCQVPGHTPGSVVFYDRSRELLFTGDAMGSGCGVWMQVPGATSLETYHAALTHLLAWLVERGGRMRFYGGHNSQQFLSRRVPGYNPLGLGLLCDLIELVEGLKTGRIVGRPSEARPFSTEPTYYAGYGRAEIEYRPSMAGGR